MPRLDVHELAGDGGSSYVLDIQADLLSDLATRVVVPLVPEDGAPMVVRNLNPVVEVRGKSYVMLIQGLASVPRRALKHAVVSLIEQHDVVARALDTLLLGF